MFQEKVLVGVVLMFAMAVPASADYIEDWENLNVGDSPTLNGWSEYNPGALVEAGTLMGGVRVLRVDGGEGIIRTDLSVAPGSDGKVFFEYDFDFTIVSGNFEVDIHAGQDVVNFNGTSVQNLRRGGSSPNYYYYLRQLVKLGPTTWQTLGSVAPGETTHVKTKINTNTGRADYVVDSPTYGEQVSLDVQMYGGTGWTPGGAITGLNFHSWYLNSIVLDNIEVWVPEPSLPILLSSILMSLLLWKWRRP